MKKIGNRFFTDKSKGSYNMACSSISSNLLTPLLYDSYIDFFNTHQSFFIKNNIHKFNSYLNSKLLLMSVGNILEENNITFNYSSNDLDTIIEIEGFKLAILDSSLNDVVSLIRTDFFKNNPKLLDCNYFIFIRFSNNFNFINLNVDPYKLKDFNYVKELVLNKNISTCTLGFLEKGDLINSLTNRNIILSKNILDNKVAITNPSYFIYNDQFESIDILLKKFEVSPLPDCFDRCDTNLLNNEEVTFIDSPNSNLQLENYYHYDQDFFDTLLDTNYISKNDLSDNNPPEDEQIDSIDNISIESEYGNCVVKENESFIKKIFSNSNKN